MSNNVDKRVVEMQFDNKQFESGVQESVKSLENLKKGLDLEKSAKGLEAIDRAASKIDLSRLSEAAESVADRFSFMGNLVQNVYNRIGDAALNAAMKVKSFVDALTIDPVRTGLDEYETQINSIQTILSNTYDSMAKKDITDEGERVAIINDRLDTLNHYADKTIYNFTQMTESIGRFTAAGVDLDTSVAAIQGIANLAAVSGSNADQASNAMYMLSQAMSAGTVTAYQWNSVMRAGMGGEVFQKAILRNAKAMDKTVDVTVEEVDKNGKKVKKTVQRTVQEIVDEMGFKESLSKGWFTSDILSATLDQFSWDFEEMAKQAGYTKETMEEGVAAMKEMKYGELLSQGFSPEEAQEMIRLAEDATNAATKVKTFTQLFDTLKEAAQSGWTETWRYIIGDFEEAKELLTSISDFFGNVIGESAEARNKIVKQWKELGGRDELIQSFWNIVYSIQNIVGLVRTEFQKVFPPKTGQQLFDMTKAFRVLTDRIKAFTENSEKMDKFRRIVAGMANGLDIVRQVIGALWDGAKQLFSYISPYAGGLVELIAKGADKITEFNANLKETSGIQKVVQKIVDFLKKVIDGVKSFSTAVKDIFSNGPQGILGKLKEWFGHFEGIGEKIGKFFDGNSILQSIKNFFSNIFTSVKDFATNMDGADIAVIIGSVLGAGVVLKITKFIKSLKDIKDKLCDGIEGISDGITDALGSFKKKGDIAKSILMIAASLALIAGALYIVSKIDPDRLGDAVLTMGIMLGAITAFAFVLSKIKLKNTAGLAVTSAGLMLLGGAMLIFAGAIERIGKLDDATIVKGIAGLGAVLLELTIFMALTKKAKMGVLKGAGLVLLAVSINMFANTIQKIGGMDTSTIARGVAGLGAVLLELAVFLALTKKAKLGVFKGAGLILLAVSLNLFSNAISKIGNMETNTIVKGIAGLGAVLLELAVFLALTKKAKLGVFKGAGLILLAVSINMFANAIQKIGSMETNTIVKGIAGLGAVLLELGVFLALTKKAKIGVFKGAGLILMAVSINMFANAVAKIGAMETSNIVKGIAGLGAVLLELAVFLALTKKAKIGVFKGAGLILMAVSINMFAETISKIGNLDTGTIVKGLVGLGVVLLELAAFLALTKKAKIGVFKGAGMILMAVSLNMFAETISKIGKLKTKTILKGVMGLGLVLLELAAFMKIMNKTKVTGITKSILMLGIMAISMQVFVHALKHLEGVEVTQMLAFSASFGTALLALSASMLLISKVPVTAAIAGIAKLALIAAAIVGLMAVFGAAEQAWSVSSYIDSFGNMTEAIGKAIGRFVGGLGAGVMQGLNLPQIGTDLSDFMTNIQPFLDGCKGVDESVKTGVSNLASAIIAIGGAEIVSAISSWFVGDNPISQFADDIGTIATALNNFASSISGFSETDNANLTNATNAAKGLAELVKAVPWQAPEWAQAIVGSKNVEGFAEDAATLATALLNYATNISGFSATVSESDVTNSTNAAKALVELQKSLPAEGGWIQSLLGIKDLSTFGDRVPGFAAGMKAYAKEISGFTSSVSQADIDNSTNAAKALIGLENSLSGEGGVLQDLLGVKDLTTFAAKVPGFASGMKAYAKEISGFSSSVTQTDIDNSTNAAKALIGLENSLPGDGGLLQNIMGVKDLTTFAAKIPGFATGMKAYATQISGFSATVSEADITNSTNAAKGLVELQNALPSEDGWIDSIIGVKDLTSFAEKIPGFASGMLAYATQITGFSSTVTEADITNSTNAAKALVELQNALPAEGGILDGLLGIKDLSSFAEKLPGFAAGMVAYANEISGFSSTVSDEDITNSTNAAKGLIELQNTLPAEGGILDSLLGIKDLSTFGERIPGFAAGMLAYATEISGFSATVSEDDITNSTNAAKALIELQNALPTEGGLLDSLFGIKDLGSFAEKIPGFAAGMIAYATEISGFTVTVSDADIANSNNAAKALIALQNALPAEGGILDSLTGIKDLSVFAERVPGFAAGMMAYATEISGFTTTVTQDDIDNSTNAAKALAELANTIPAEGGWIQTILGQQNLGTFGEKCAQFGAGLASFASNIGAVSTEETSNAIAAMGLITQFTSGLNSEGGIFNAIGEFFGGTQDIVSLSEKMATVGTNLATFATELSTADFSNTEQATQLMTDMQTFIGTLETKGGVWADISEWFGGSKDIVGLSSTMASFATNFSTFAAGITGASQAATDFSIVQTVVTAFTTLADSVKNDNIDTKKLEATAKTMGTTFVTAMSTAISDGGDKVGTAATSASSAGTTAAEGTYKTWESTGKNLGQGLANGIAAMAGNVKRAAVNAASGATRAIQITWSVHSPSRVGRDLGMNFDLGIAGGLDRYSKVVSQSATGMGENAIESARSMLRGADASVFDYIDPNPTIRPVLDLSNIQSGVSALGGMLNSDQIVNSGLFQGLNFNKGVNALNFDGARIVGGQTNKDVVSELQALSTRFDDLNEAVTNMKVVLDSGELVGATSGKMDNELGTRAMRKGRGN